MRVDIRADWTHEALLVAEKWRKKSGSPDFLISTSGSYSAHLAASSLAIKTGVPWIADYGDPWSLNPLSSEEARQRSKPIEERMLQACNLMTVTTAQTAEAYKNWLIDNCPKVKVIPCGFEKQNEETVEISNRTISYVGTAGSGNRDLRQIMHSLEIFNKGISKESRFDLQIIGSTSPLFEKEAQKLESVKINFSGWVTYEKSIELINASKILILLGNKRGIQVPGKVFPYLASMRPILYIRQLPFEEKDPTEEILKDFSGIYYAINEVKSIHEILLKINDNLENAEASAKMRKTQEKIKEFSWARISDLFASCVDKVKSER